MNINSQPTRDQIVIINKAINWYYNDTNNLFFEYSGPAGSGKTFTLKKIIERLNLQDDEFLAMALTGTATNVLKKNGFIKSKTLHSSLYLYDKNNISKFILSLQHIEFDKIKLICIDEGQLIPIEIRVFIERQLQIKTIVCGDYNQVSLLNNPSKMGFFRDYSKIIYLNKPLRFRRGSLINIIANNLYDNDFHKLRDNYFNINNNSVLIIDTSSFLQNITKYVSEYGIILSNTYFTKNIFNYIIRRELYGFTNIFPQTKDILICRKNNWHLNTNENEYNLVNGTIGKIYRMTPLINLTSDYLVLNFQPLEKEFNGKVFHKLKVDYDFFIDNYGMFTDYNPAKMRSQEFTIIADTNIVIDYDKYNKYYNIFDYAYCLTTQFSQGSEYKSGIYFQDELTFDMNTKNRLAYTAITRFKNKCLCVLPDIIYKLFITNNI